MKIPLNWLEEFVSHNDIKHNTLSEEISLKAFEVEEICPHTLEMKGPVVAGKIIDIQPHPDADKLQVTQIQTNPDKPEDLLQIVCGAKNIKINQIVPVAMLGSAVINYKTNELLAIKKGKLRGVESQGMLCSAGELNIQGSNSEGIYILENNIPIGSDLLELLNLKPDYVLDIESRSNREDALCVQGIAREVSLVLDRELKIDYYNTDYKANLQKLISSSGNNININIESQDTCSGALFAKLSNVQVKDSPEYIKNRLEQSGIKVINNIVDILNYVMLEVGQPMHAYDLAKFPLENNNVYIRQALSTETEVKALDDNTYKLSPEKSLIITNNKQTGCIAGVMGSLETSITDSTQDVLLEIACFDSATIRHSSRHSGISTDASRRYERGTNTELLYIAFCRTLELLQEHSGAQITDYAENILQAHTSNNININLDDYKRIIGLEITSEQALNILEKLNIKILSQSNNILELEIPVFRIKDIIRPVDVYEELARFQGLNNIQEQALPALNNINKYTNKQDSLKNILISQGYLETWSSSLVSEEELNINYISELTHQPVQMKNPLSRDYSYLRNSLLPNFIKAVKYNTSRQAEEIKLFEISKIYGYKNTERANPERETNALEIPVLGLVYSAKEKLKKINWQGQKTEINNFYNIKALIEQAVQAPLKNKGRLTYTAINSLDETAAQAYTKLHPGISTIIKLNNQYIGYIGKIHPGYATEQEISSETFIAQILLEPIYNFASKQKAFKTNSLNNNQIMSRDFTLDLSLDSKINYSQLSELINKAKLEYLINSNFLGLFKNTETNKQALTFRLEFQAPSNTEVNLTSEHINSQVNNLINKLQSKYSEIEFRA